jgi:hypothetical protein
MNFHKGLNLILIDSINLRIKKREINLNIRIS